MTIFEQTYEQKQDDNVGYFDGKHINYDWMKGLDYDEMRKVRRKFWTFVMWPKDDADMSDDVVRHDFRSDIASRLSDMVIPSLISPIHDKDFKDGSTVELAKPHVHVISLWENPTRYNVVLNALQIGCGFEGVKYIQPVVNIRAMMRYLIHLDNPEKIQYSPLDVIEVAGAQYVLEDETCSETVIAAIIDNHIQTLTQALTAFNQHPSCQKWIMANVGLVKTLCHEQRDMTKKEYDALIKEIGNGI